MDTGKSVEFLIDYLTITKPKLSIDTENGIAAMLHDYDGRERWEGSAPPKGYRLAVKNDIGAVGASGRAEQGTLLSWSGSALKQADAMFIARTAMSNDWRITRLDLTMDFLGFETTVEDYKQEYENGQCNTTARTWDERKSAGGGHTFYVGSYASARFMRIYNKTASEARFTDVKTLPEKWIRCELRLGDEHARSAFGYLSENSIDSAIPALLRGYADFPNIDEYRDSSRYPCTTFGKGKVDSNRQKWLLEQVFNPLVEELLRDEEFQHKFMGQLMKALGF